MPFKNPDDLRAWKVGYRDKQRVMTKDWHDRHRSELKEKYRVKTEPIRAEKAIEKERKDNIEALSWAMNHGKGWGQAVLQV